MVDLLRKILLENELSGDESLIYRFSDADGERTGRSGWSFGISQFDVNHNPDGILCLRDCDFTTDEISGLQQQSIDIEPMNGKLSFCSDIIDQYDNEHFDQTLKHISNLCKRSHIFLESGVIYHLADYHNQFYMSRNGKMHSYLKMFKRRIKQVDILNFKLDTVWGKKRPDDVYRRYNNIVDLIGSSY